MGSAWSAEQSLPLPCWGHCLIPPPAPPARPSFSFGLASGSSPCLLFPGCVLTLHAPSLSLLLSQTHLPVSAWGPTPSLPLLLILLLCPCFLSVPLPLCLSPFPLPSLYLSAPHFHASSSPLPTTGLRLQVSLLFLLSPLGSTSLTVFETNILTRLHFPASCPEIIGSNCPRSLRAPRVGAFHILTYLRPALDQIVGVVHRCPLYPGVAVLHQLRSGWWGWGPWGIPTVTSSGQV